MVGVGGECLEGREEEDFFLLFIYLYLWLCWVFIVVHGVSNCGKWGQLFIAVLQLLVAWARGFSICSSQATEVAPAIVAYRLSCSEACGIFLG